MKVSVSYLSSVFDKKSTIHLIDHSDADFIHADLMDGKFVDKRNFEVHDVIEELKEASKPLDIHLMTYTPEIYIEKFSVLHPEYITFHLESNTDISKTIELIHSFGCKAGIAIKPNTDVSYLEPYLNDIDLILVMTVEPGAGGQRFMFPMLDKVKDLKDYKLNKGYKYLISVDGGINEYTALLCKKSGADIAVSGSYICRTMDFDSRIKNIKK